MKNYSCTIFLFVFLMLLAVSCATGPQFMYTGSPDITAFPVYPDISFGVITDQHLHTESLGNIGPDFTGELRSGKKMLHLAEEISNTVADKLINDNAISFVLVCGDLTRDGEKENHYAMQKIFSRIEDSGKQVYVVPGNHDINNFNARRFTKTGSEQTSSVSADEFRMIYSKFGFSEAVFSDPASLSYIAEPSPGLWLFALDACTYTENKQGQANSTYGRFLPETLQWIEEKLILAGKQNKAVIGLVHHGVLEHFTSQKKYFKEFVIDNWEPVSKMFANYGMRLVFTGHFHAQDITAKIWNNNSYLYDVETSSLVTFPCAFRKVHIKDNKAHINSYPITQITSIPDFQEYAKTHLSSGVSVFLRSYLDRFEFEEKDYEIIIPQMIEGIIAHTTGDEAPPEKLMDTKGLSLKASIVLCFANDLLKGVWTDLPPKDNNIQIDLSTGTWNSIQ